MYSTSDRKSCDAPWEAACFVWESAVGETRRETRRCCAESKKGETPEHKVMSKRWGLSECGVSCISYKSGCRSRASKTMFTPCPRTIIVENKCKRERECFRPNTCHARWTSNQRESLKKGNPRAVIKRLKLDRTRNSLFPPKGSFFSQYLKL